MAVQTSYQGWDLANYTYEKLYRLKGAIPSGLETRGFVFLGRSDGVEGIFFPPWYFFNQ
jgi:hypothetical protein